MGIAPSEHDVGRLTDEQLQDPTNPRGFQQSGYEDRFVSNDGSYPVSNTTTTEASTTPSTSPTQERDWNWTKLWSKCDTSPAGTTRLTWDPPKNGSEVESNTWIGAPKSSGLPPERGSGLNSEAQSATRQPQTFEGSPQKELCPRNPKIYELVFRVQKQVVGWTRKPSPRPINPSISSPPRRKRLSMTRIWTLEA